LWFTATSTRTTQRYDRRRCELSLDEVERIVIWSTARRAASTRAERLTFSRAQPKRMGSDENSATEQRN
jgi:hypothetical protein